MLFSIVAALIYNPSSAHRFPFSTSLPTLVFCVFLKIVAILMGVRWYLSVVLIRISLMISNMEHLFMDLFAIYIYLLWRIVYSSPLLTF